jgi:thiol-disulfide isomerase/thioredoxin
MSENVREVNERDLDQVVLESKTPVLVDVWAEWCGPCLTLAPIVEAIAEQYRDAARVFKLNVDDGPAVAQREARLGSGLNRALTPASSALVVPTTKLLAIGSFTAKATPDAWKPILPSEARETALLYFNGKIDQWYVKQDQSGVVFILNVTDPKQAHDLLDKLPLGKAGLMEFQIIPLGPLSPLRLLLSEPTK